MAESKVRKGLTTLSLEVTPNGSGEVRLDQVSNGKITINNFVSAVARGVNYASATPFTYANSYIYVKVTNALNGNPISSPVELLVKIY